MFFVYFIPAVIALAFIINLFFKDSYVNEDDDDVFKCCGKKMND